MTNQEIIECCNDNEFGMDWNSEKGIALRNMIIGIIERQKQCSNCSRRKWYQMGYKDGKICTSDCPFNIGKPCPAAEGCPGWEDRK